MAFEIFPRSKKQRNKDLAEERKAKGDVSEDVEAGRAMQRGNIVRNRDQRKGGFDQYQTPVNIFGQQTGPTKHVEIKSSIRNRETAAQRRQKKNDPNYERRDVNLDSIPGASVLVDGKILENRFKKKSMKDILYGS